MAQNGPQDEASAAFMRPLSGANAPARTRIVRRPGETLLRVRLPGVKAAIGAALLGPALAALLTATHADLGSFQMVCVILGPGLFFGLGAIAGNLVVPKLYGEVAFRPSNGTVECNGFPKFNLPLAEIAGVQACCGWIGLENEDHEYQLNLVRTTGGRQVERYCVATVAWRREAVRVGRALAEEMGVPFYDHASSAAMAMHDPDGVRTAEKASRNSWILGGVALVLGVVSICTAPVYGVLSLVPLAMATAMGAMAVALIREWRDFFRA